MHRLAALRQIVLRLHGTTPSRHPYIKSPNLRKKAAARPLRNTSRQKAPIPCRSLRAFPRFRRVATATPANVRNSRSAVFAAVRRTRQKTTWHKLRPKCFQKTIDSPIARTPPAGPAQSRIGSANSPASSPSTTLQQSLCPRCRSAPGPAALAPNPESRNNLRPLAAPACKFPRTPASPSAANSEERVSPVLPAQSPIRAPLVAPPRVVVPRPGVLLPSRASLRHNSPVRTSSRLRRENVPRRCPIPALPCQATTIALQPWPVFADRT